MEHAGTRLPGHGAGRPVAAGGVAGARGCLRADAVGARRTAEKVG